MTTPTNFQILPSVSSFHNGQMVMGAQASSLALALKQLTNVKFRSAAYYHIGYGTYYIIYIGAQIGRGTGAFSKGETEDIDLLVGTMPTSEWLAIELVYSSTNEAGETPSVTIELYTLGTTSPKGTKIDVGIKFEAPYDLAGARNSSGADVYRSHTGAQSYAFPAGGLSTFTAPRPLYVPPAYRGEVLLLCVQSESCRVLALNVFDIYQEA